MAAILATVEAKINDYLQPKNKEDKMEKTINKIETISGFPRERIVSAGLLMLSSYVFLGTYFPFFSHCICVYWPIKESFKVLRQQAKPSDNLLLYWILYAMVSLFDFSSLPNIPIYYFAKTGLFVSITSNGMEKLKEWSEPALKFTESWVFVAAQQPEVVEEQH
ncbi:hypothetical protein CAEBREN_06045 [Caenorhabditis brenneri]|uniref:Uncharacterized protein n=1 Tax=Caenorhabditis brenneri TaxID=135651 RepID=G0NGP3_CAEBE|nr:hypothetical protein CAEBREN_06045 [Caenorhabditis brenneri]